MRASRHTISFRRGAAILLLAAAAPVALAGCSSAGSAGSEPADVVESGAAANPDIDPAMIALCDQMVADGLTTDEATRLAEDSGYAARVGSIDGEPQAVTMDYRIDRFTFEIVDDVVMSCTFG